MKLSQIDHISEGELLQTRICDFDFNLKDSKLIRGVNDLYFELNQKLINFHPHIWVSDDWFSPDGTAGFAIPFYLFHRRLIQLEKKNIGIVEGNTQKSFMKLLRHETGHALDNAFYLRRLKTRQNIFGLSSTPYPKSYLPKANTKDFVIHFEEFYAQAHPDEDWAETFAIWLTPDSNWEHKYKNWKALSKLEYIDKVMTSLINQKQKSTRIEEVSHYKKDTRTLEQYFKEKRKEKRLNNSNILDKVDNKLVSYIISNRTESRKIIENLTKDKFIADKLIKDVTLRYKTLNIKSKTNIKIHATKLEKNILNLTQGYLKQGRHRIIM